MKPKRYFLDRDNDCHWFLVEADRRSEWDAWTALDTDNEAAWEPPGYATPLQGGPMWVTFEQPQEEV